MSTQIKRKRGQSNAIPTQIRCKSTPMATKHKLAINGTIVNASNHKYLDRTATKARRSKKKKSRRSTNTLAIPKHIKHNKQQKQSAKKGKKARNPLRLLKLKDNKTLRIVGLPKLSAKIIKLYRKFGVIENIVHGKPRRKRGQTWVQIEYKTAKSAHQAIRWTNNVLFQFCEKFVKCKSTTGWRQKYKYSENQKNAILSAQEQQHFDNATSGEIRGLVYDAEMEQEVSISKVIKENKKLQQNAMDLKQKIENLRMQMDQKPIATTKQSERGPAKQIISFIEHQIGMKTGNILFASGHNDSGLNGAVQSVFHSFVANKNDNLENICQINANCFDKCDAASAYSLIYSKIMNKAEIPRIPRKNLLKRILSGKSLENKKMYILLIYKRNQKVLANLLTWSKKTNSKLILFGISNAVPIIQEICKKP